MDRRGEREREREGGEREEKTKKREASLLGLLQERTDERTREGKKGWYSLNQNIKEEIPD